MKRTAGCFPSEEPNAVLCVSRNFGHKVRLAFLCAFIHLCLFVHASCACVSARMPLRLRVRNQDAHGRR